MGSKRSIDPRYVDPETTQILVEKIYQDLYDSGDLDDLYP